MRATSLLDAQPQGNQIFTVVRYMLAFNSRKLIVKMPLKAIVRGFSWTVVPITWRKQPFVVPKLKIKEMGSRCLYFWL
jgi:hypothetical protein